MSVVNAAAIIREYEEDFYDLGYKCFSFKVRIVIETEPNDKWKLNTYYQEDFIITLTYLNESRFHAEGFRLFFHSPMRLLETLYGAGDYEIINNETSVWLGHNGKLTVRYRIKAGVRYQLKSMVRYSAYQDNEVQFGGAYWTSPEPIWIDLEQEHEPSPDYTTPIVFTCIGIAIGIIPIGTYLIFKSRKSKRKKNMQ